MTSDVSGDLSRKRARTVLAADGVGCLAAAGAVLISDRVLGTIDPTLTSRPPLTRALLATGALLLRGASRKRPRPKDLRRAAVANLGWVLVCAASRRSVPTRTGWWLLVSTAVFDGTCGWLQWKLGSGKAQSEG